MLDDSNFVTDQVHERTVTLADGKEHKLYFREVPAGVYEMAMTAMRSEDPDTRKGGVPRLIAASLCEADGSPAITVEKAAQLKPGVSLALANAAFEINPPGYTGKG